VHAEEGDGQQRRAEGAQADQDRRHHPPLWWRAHRQRQRPGQCAGADAAHQDAQTVRIVVCIKRPRHHRHDGQIRIAEQAGRRHHRQQAAARRAESVRSGSPRAAFPTARPWPPDAADVASSVPASRSGGETRAH
jgi:hypothetical protein